MKYEDFKKQAYLAALTGLLAARGKDPVFDNGVDKNGDRYFTLLDNLHGISEIAEEIAKIETLSLEFDE